MQRVMLDKHDKHDILLQGRDKIIRLRWGGKESSLLIVGLALRACNSIDSVMDDMWKGPKCRWYHLNVVDVITRRRIVRVLFVKVPSRAAKR